MELRPKLPGFAATEPPMTVSSTLDLSSLESLLHAAAMDLPPVLLALFHLHTALALALVVAKRRNPLMLKRTKLSDSDYGTFEVHTSP
jgi:hypothetical protein